MGRLRSVAGWIVQGIFTGTLLGLYWFYRTPENPLESMMAATFCLVSSWICKKILEFMISR